MGMNCGVAHAGAAHTLFSDRTWPIAIAIVDVALMCPGVAHACGFQHTRAITHDLRLIFASANTKRAGRVRRAWTTTSAVLSIGFGVAGRGIAVTDAQATSEWVLAHIPRASAIVIIVGGFARVAGTFVDLGSRVETADLRGPALLCTSTVRPIARQRGITASAVHTLEFVWALRDAAAFLGVRLLECWVTAVVLEAEFGRRARNMGAAAVDVLFEHEHALSLVLEAELRLGIWSRGASSADTGQNEGCD